MANQSLKVGFLAIVLVTNVQCATPIKNSDSNEAEDLCKTLAKAELESIGNDDADKYVYKITKTNDGFDLDVSPPPFKDPQKDIPFFGGGGNFKCDKKGNIIERQFDR